MSDSHNNASQPLTPPAGGVAVRAYRQGLGDCFLLAFATRGARPAYVLIDCGVHGAQKNGRANLRAILEDIIATTGGKLDALVVTHEHTDHLSAFVTEADRIAPYNEKKKDDKRLRIQRLWLGWTEDPSDPLAQSLDKARRTAERALAAVLGRIEQQVADRRLGAMEGGELRGMIESALSFTALDGDASSLAAAGTKQKDSAKALDMLRERAGSVAYMRPGQPPLRIPGTAAARAYVLGPPLDVKLLKKSKPSSGERQETYLTGAMGLLSFAAAALGADEDAEMSRGEIDRNELCNPFAPAYRIPSKHAGQMPYFRQWYGVGDSGHDYAWRQIDNDWLFAAEQLAIDVGTHTNNTSLALAFELGPRGRSPVLLFVADAQVGSWLSWRDLAWGKRPRVTTRDLFARTVLYKVGHHASHNATLRRDAQGNDYGLELMPGPLVAFIPVDHAAASKLRGWDMPAHNLYQALLRKAPRRVLRADEAPDAAVPPKKDRAVPGCRGLRWRRSAATKADGEGPLYYDLFLQPHG